MNAPSRWTVRVLAWTALGLSAYLTLTSLSHTKVVGCAGGEAVDCDSVLSGRWSTWLGLPVALGGLACYTALASLTVLLGTRHAASRRWVSPLVIMLAIVAGGAGLWFIGLQLLVLHEICTYCMAVHTCGVTIAALVLWTLVVRPVMDRRRLSRKEVGRQVLTIQARSAQRGAPDSLRTPGLGAPSLGIAFSGALAMLMVLVVGQVFFPPETFSTVSSEGLSQTIEMDAAPAASVLPGANNPQAGKPSADGGKDTSRSRSPAASAGRPRQSTAADDLFAQLDQPAGNDDAADLFAAGPDETSTNHSAAEIDRPANGAGSLAGEEKQQPGADVPPTNTTAAESSENAPGRPAIATDPPVVPVSAAGDHHSAAMADWRSVAANSAEPVTPKPERKVALLNGRLKLDMYQHPVLGPMDAPNVIVELMSYNCPHCRRMHDMIVQGLKRYEGQLAIVEMVVPLEMGCNKYITEPKYSHRGSCTLTRLALGVATIDRTAFGDFHDWLLADPAEPPSPEEATARAYQVVDRDRLRAVMQSDEVEEQIDNYVGLYRILQDLSEKQHKAFGLPVQIVGPTVVSGDLANAGELYWAWEKNLGLRPHGSAAVDQTSSNP